MSRTRSPEARPMAGLIRTAIANDRFIQIVLAVGMLLVLSSALVSVILPGDPNAPDFSLRLVPPGFDEGLAGVFGYDQLGRSVLMRSLYGLRTSYTIAICAVALGALIGITAGLISGYFGGLADKVIAQLISIQMSFPTLLIIMAVVKVIGGGIFTLIIILGLVSWMLCARVVRSVVLQRRATDFVSATVALGATPLRVMVGHLLPNAAPAIVAVATLEMASLILAESTLSFLGFGAQPPTISLGAILAGGRDYLANQWWVSTFSGLMLGLAGLTSNLIGNWIERRSDPLDRRLNRGRL